MTIEFGWSLFVSGNIGGAEREARKCLGQAPEDERALLLLARCHLARGEWREAETLGRELVGLYPESPDAWMARGFAESACGRYVTAKEAFERAIDLDPGDAGAHAALASLHLSMDVTGKAGEHFAEALRLDPDDPEIIVGNAKFLRATGKPAMALIRRGLELAPDNPDIVLLMAELALEDGRLEEARERTGWVLERNPEDREALFLLAKIRGHGNFLLGQFMRLEHFVSGLSMMRQVIFAGVALAAFILLRQVLLIFGPVWLHHLFVLFAAGLALLVALSGTIRDMLIEREMKKVSLHEDY